MPTQININPDIDSLRAAFRALRSEAQQTQSVVSQALDTTGATADLDRMRKTATSLKEALDKVGEKTKIDVDVKDADKALSDLEKKVKEVGGGSGTARRGRRSQAMRDEEDLFRLRRSHLQQEQALRRQFTDRQARDADRAFRNYARLNPHLRQFDSFGDFLTRGRAQYGRDYDQVRRQVTRYVNQRAGITGLGGRPSWLRSGSRAAGALGGAAGGLIAGAGAGGGGLFGSLGGLSGAAIGGLTGMVGGGPLGAIAGSFVGGAAGTALGAFGGQLDAAIRRATEEAMVSSNLARTFGAAAPGFDAVRDASRVAGDRSGLSYAAAARQASLYARTAALRTPGNLTGALSDAFGFGRSMGVGQEAGVSFMATMRGTGAAGDERAARRIGTAVAEAIRRGGLGPQADAVLTAVQRFAQNATQRAFQSPDVRAFSSLLSNGASLNLPGLTAGGMGGIIQTADAALRAGGRMGGASRVVAYDALSRLDPSMNVFEMGRVMQGGMFGTIGGAFGRNSAAVAEARSRLAAARRTGDTDAAARAQADLARYASLAGGRNANVTQADAVFAVFDRMGGSTAEQQAAMAGHFGLTQDQVSALSAAHRMPGGIGGQMSRLQGMLGGADINFEAMPTMLRVLSGDRAELNALAGRILGGREFGSVTGTEASSITAQMRDGSDDALRLTLLQTLQRIGGPLSRGERLSQSQQQANNAMTRMADRLIPISERIQLGITALVEKLAPDTASARALASLGVISAPMTPTGEGTRAPTLPGVPASDAGDETASAPTIFGRDVRPLLDQISRGEGTTDAQARAAGFASGYDAVLGMGRFGRPDKPLTSMTLDEVQAYQRTLRANSGRLNSSAVGRYQIVGTTLRRLMQTMGLSGDTLFSPELQDRMGLRLANQRGLGQYVSGTMPLHTFQNNMHYEWASIASPNTGRALQRTGTTSDQFAAALPGAGDASVPTPDVGRGAGTAAAAGSGRTTNVQIVVTDKSGAPSDRLEAHVERVSYDAAPAGAFAP